MSYPAELEKIPELRMETDQSHTTERILNLTLEIIYLMTGENYIAFKLSDGLVTSNMLKTHISDIKSPPHSLHKDNKKIQEFTREIIELLAGEVPLRCQDGTMYFSMEQWENIGHRDLYKDIMMENQPPLSSPDGSSNRNTPERCPRPLDSQDYSKEHPEISYDDLDESCILSGTKARKAAEELSVRDDQPLKEEKTPPQIPTDPGDSNEIWEEIGSEGKVNHVMIKVEPTPPEISPGGRYMRGTTDKYPTIYPDCEIGDEEDIISTSTKENPITPDLQEAAYSADLLSNPSTRGGWLSGDYYPTVQREDNECSKSIPCPECGKCFSEKSKLATHWRSHTGEKPFSCMDCGKSFKQRAHLVSHHRTHTRVHPYSCSECGKCFSQKSNLIRHEKVHTGERSFSCHECGKRFSEKSNLLRHEKIHTGEKPYSCSECGRCFSLRANLIAHVRTHTGDKPFACSQCGKCFSRKSVLIIHERVHTGEKPYSCTDCGKSFSKRFLLARHTRLHTGQKMFDRTMMESLPKQPVSSFTRGLSEVINHYCYQAVDSYHMNSSFSHGLLPEEERRLHSHDVAGE